MLRGINKISVITRKESHYVFSIHTIYRRCNRDLRHFASQQLQRKDESVSLAQYLNPEIEPDQLAAAVEAYKDWKACCRLKPAGVWQILEIEDEKRRRYSIVLKFPRHVMAEAMRVVNQKEV